MGDSYWDVFSLEDSHDFLVVPLLCLYLGVSLVFRFMYGAFWISVEAENVVEVEVVFVGCYLTLI